MATYNKAIKVTVDGPREPRTKSNYQYGYGIPGMPGSFNPFLLNPGWLDAAYMSYAWPDYFRNRTTNIHQSGNVHPSIVKGSALPSPLQPSGESAYLPHIPPPTSLHHPGYLPPNSLQPPFQPGDLPKLPFDPFQLRPLQPSPLEQLSIRVSPMSSNLSLSPQSSTLAQETKIHSTVDQSNSESSDEEDIDVVKSAFVPIKPANLVLQEIQHPDSTVQDKEPTKLKAPSSKSLKQIVVSPKSPNTKIQTAPTISTTKNVWRPY